MADERRDPRVPVLNHERAVYASVPATFADTRVILTKVDAADPLRQRFPEVVEALAESSSALESIWDCYMADRMPDMERWHDAMKHARTALTRARALTPEKENDDG